MKCPVCKSTTIISAKEDINHPDDYIDLQVFCDECDWSGYTFIHTTDLTDCCDFVLLNFER